MGAIETRGVRYAFHPVGQGLFASGALGNCPSRWMGTGQGDIRFLWVYDCGTSSQQVLLKEAIDRFAGAYVATKRILDMVVLSHFDSDHISGVVDLLGRFEVDVLLLPYVPLAHRIILAFHEGIPVDDTLFSFFIDPVGYLNEAGVRGIRRIVFVPPGNGEGPGPAATDDPDRPNPDRWPEQEDAYRLVFDSHPMPANGVGEKERIGSVSMLARSSVLRAGAVWEFVPYNDQTLAVQPDESWIKKVEDLRGRLLQEKQRKKRAEVLAHLRDRYDEEFGTHSKERNQISLFLYGGPVSASAPDGCRGNHGWTFRGEPLFLGSGELVRGWRAADRPGKRAAVLYTGDGYLNSKIRMEALAQFLGNARIDRTAVFQVMHHGAAKNWIPGVASVIGPWFSVFSSDPDKGYRHPHAEVLRDFWLCGPLQVKGDSDAEIHVWWEWRPKD